MTKRFKRVMVTGGAGYVGSSLVPKLLAAGYEVSVLDLYLYGDELFADHRGPNLREVKGDLRNPADVALALEGCDAVIHLACISNDPSFDLDPDPDLNFLNYLMTSYNQSTFGDYVLAFHMGTTSEASSTHGQQPHRASAPP